MIKKILPFLFVLTGNIQALTWKNWAKNQQCKVKLVTPNNIEQLIDFIKKNQTQKSKIHAYGTGHSWNNIVCTNGYLINTNKLNKVISINIEKKQVTVQAGIKVKDLNEYLAKHNLCLSNQGAIAEQSLAGIVSTATHGSGKTGTFASFVIELQLLTADGDLLSISETENSDLFPAVCTGIGSLGIITQMTIQCETLFKLKYENKIMGWDEIIKEYQELLDNNDYMQFTWYAKNDSVNVTIHNRTQDNSEQGTLKQKSKRTKIIRENKQADYSYKMLSGKPGQIYMEIEIAIPRNNFVEAAKIARNLVKKENDPNFDAILFRFVSADNNSYLSPACQKDVVYFSITTLERKNYENFFKKFYDLMLRFDGRPHWGKINFLDQKTTKKLYLQNFDKFIEIRKRLDPDGIFSNDFTKKIFGY